MSPFIKKIPSNYSWRMSAIRRGSQEAARRRGCQGTFSSSCLSSSSLFATSTPTARPYSSTSFSWQNSNTDRSSSSSCSLFAEQHQQQRRRSLSSYAAPLGGDAAAEDRLPTNNLARGSSLTSTFAAASLSSSLSSDPQQQQQPPRLAPQDDPEVVLRECGRTADDLWQWAQRKPTPLRLADMYQYAANPDFRIPNAVFLHTELPIRVAQRAVDLLTLPFGLSDAPPIRQVASTYIRYWHTILSSPVPQKRVDEEEFTAILQSLVLDRASIPQAIAQGLAIWQAQAKEYNNNNNNNTTMDSKREKDDEDRYHEMEEALYRFFTARVGLRFLTEHHVLSSPWRKQQQLQQPPQQRNALREVTKMFDADDDDDDDEDELQNNTTTVGCIQSHMNLVKEVHKVAALVREECAAEFNLEPSELPDIEVVDCQRQNKDDSFTYVPHHVHYMMLELLKNSMRATLRHYRLSGNKNNSNVTTMQGEEDEDGMPAIRVVMVKGDEDVTIKVADKAGGIPRSRMAQIWKFAHSSETTDGSSSTNTDGSKNTATNDNDVSGTQLRGFGLPITRIYARYFGGELTLKSMEGYGLDAYLHLPRLGKSGEHLPRRVRSSPGELDSMPSVGTSLYGKSSSSLNLGSSSSSNSSSSNSVSNANRHFSTITSALEAQYAAEDAEIEHLLRKALLF